MAPAILPFRVPGILAGSLRPGRGGTPRDAACRPAARRAPACCAAATCGPPTCGASAGRPPAGRESAPLCHTVPGAAPRSHARSAATMRKADLRAGVEVNVGHAAGIGAEPAVPARQYAQRTGAGGMEVNGAAGGMIGRPARPGDARAWPVPGDDLNPSAGGLDPGKGRFQCGRHAGGRDRRGGAAGGKFGVVAESARGHRTRHCCRHEQNRAQSAPFHEVSSSIDYVESGWKPARGEEADATKLRAERMRARPRLSPPGPAVPRSRAIPRCGLYTGNDRGQTTGSRIARRGRPIREIVNGSERLNR